MQQSNSTNVVAKWIFIGMGMLIIQTLIGGITRLTGSGLSITEWKPIVGALPPLSEAEWQSAFVKYQQIAQFKYLNQHFTVGDFKFIFFWEWFHRLWARLIGLVFLFPFIYFLAKKYFKQWMLAPLLILFLLGALQGAVGWVMVKSGLNDSDVYVNHIRLAAHFMAAMVLICYALVFGLKLTLKQPDFIENKTTNNGAVFLVVLVSIQLIYGAFMAGLKAADAAPTWPSINGAIIPSAGDGSFFELVFHDKIIIHFIHRTLAYGIGIGVFAWWWKARKIKQSAAFNQFKNSTIILVFTQILLGIFAVLNSPKIVLGKFGVFESIALLHQLTGIFLLLSLMANIYITGKRRIVL